MKLSDNQVKLLKEAVRVILYKERGVLSIWDKFPENVGWLEPYTTEYFIPIEDTDELEKLVKEHREDLEVK